MVPTTQKLISLTEASAKYPGNPSVPTLHRWCLRGVCGHRLESFRIGGRRFTTEAALGKFWASLNPQAELVDA